MRLPAMVVFLGILTVAIAEPDPKKYKPDAKDNKNSSLTDEERQFLREVEAKFGIKSDVPTPKEEINNEERTFNSSEIPKKGFPAIIAIEIVNDTDSNSKGKRTIDANLGYGYKTNKGYSYTYFGKPSQEKGKFMIYPYSQEDIPPARPSHQRYSDHIRNNNRYKHSQQSYRHNNLHSNPAVNVEIQPSQAYELVPVQEDQSNGHITQPQSHYTTPSSPHAGQENHYKESSPPSTLYTTYNEGQLSGLSGQFPAVMSNYFVDPSQLLNSPQYQNAGLTSDHLRAHGQKLNQQIVPVLVLRVPSSYLKNPSAELYANLPQNYPLSNYLSNVNLQELVNQYFKKIGYTYAPQVMTYQSPIPVPPLSYEAQQYSAPRVRPMYTHADYAGVQYSAVQPVMARYPIAKEQGYSEQQYYVPQHNVMYQQVEQQPKYQYQYQYMQPAQAYYYPQHHERQPAVPENNVEVPSAEYGVPQAGQEFDVVHSTVSQNKPHAVYGPVQPQSSEYSHYSPPKSDYGPTKVSISVKDSPKTTNKQYSSAKVTYGPPQPVPIEYEPRKIESSTYGPPKSLPTTYVLTKNIAAGYGQLNPASIEYRQQIPEYESSKPEYGPPKLEYGQPKPEYGPSKLEYGQPKPEYGPPKLEYGPQKSAPSEYASKPVTEEYDVPKVATSGYLTPNEIQSHYLAQIASAYGVSEEDISSKVYPSNYVAANSLSSTYGAANTNSGNQHSSIPEYGVSNGPVQYVMAQQPHQKETIAVYDSGSGTDAHNQNNHYIYPDPSGTQSYVYQKIIGPDSQSNSLVISENYPSNDHTHAHATALPYGAKPSRNQQATVNTGIQTVKYVTPMPSSTKYHSQYKVMVPQTVLKSNENVSYINHMSHSIPSHFLNLRPSSEDSNPEEEYTVPSNYSPPVGSQKPPTFPRNYHSHPKRMTRKENKEDVDKKTKKEKLDKEVDSTEKKPTP